MDLWIPITLAAAFCQNLRSALQKGLKRTLSTWGATASRFVFAAPFAVTLPFIVAGMDHTSLPVPQYDFYVYGIMGGLAQIVATGLLLHLFSRANFAAATAFTKTEPIQTALIGIVLLGDTISLPVGFAILISLIGVIIVSVSRTPGSRWRLDENVWIGIASGALFGLSSVAFRGASLSLPEGTVLLRAATTLAFVTLFQSVAISLWLLLREKGQLILLLKAWRVAGLVGLVGMLGSLAWYTAFTLQNAAHVRALGQVEVIFTIAASILFFRETISLREIAGILLMAIGVVGLVLLTG